MIGEPEATWGDGLKARIAAAGTTRVELAGKLKVTRARVGELCSRVSPPRIETVLRLAEALGCDPSDLDPRLAPKA